MTTAVTRRAATGQEPAASAHQTVEDLLQRVEHRLQSFLAAERGRYAEVHSHAVVAIDALSDLVTAGGKLIRPAYCLTGYLAAGGEADAPGIVDAAAALELLHISALVHDDVLDDSRTRRGRPAVHLLHSTLHRTRGWQGESRRFGEGVALLVGDLALVYSDELMSHAPSGGLAEWHHLRSEVMIGQYMDVAAAAEFTADPGLSRLIALIKSGRYTIHRPWSSARARRAAPTSPPPSRSTARPSARRSSSATTCWTRSATPLRPARPPASTSASTR